MITKHTVFKLSYLIIFILNCLAAMDVAPVMSLVVKPLICISLATFLAVNVDMKAGFNRLVFAALMFSLIGDCLLLVAVVAPGFFILGLLAFLIAHILYALAFFRDFKNSPQSSKIFGHLMLFVMGVFSLSYYTWIRDSLNELRIPVMAYMFVISIMAILAGYRYRRVNLVSFRHVYIGAIFFVISDAILAYNKFVGALPTGSLLIMATYMIAQYLITMGTVKRIVQIT